MAGEQTRLDQIVSALLEHGGTKEQRKRLLRELVRRGDELPDEIVNSALQKLMERLAD